MLYAAVLQARLGSTRLPRKVLLQVSDRSMLAHIGQQLSASKRISEIVISTGFAPEDDELAEFAESHSMRITRAPIDDIVTRLVTSSRAAQANAVVRVWGDCPFVCPDVIDEMIAEFEQKELLFINNTLFDKSAFPSGLDIEIYRTSLLLEMDRAITDVKLREFPFEYVRRCLDQESWCTYYPNEDFSKYYLTVDYQDDLEAARTILKELQIISDPFLFDDLKRVMRDKPSLFECFSTQNRNIEYTEYLAKWKIL
jgi:spore coat polysaccharide biosynthesis protein SpsF (cytidylyltransferase family)